MDRAIVSSREARAKWRTVLDTVDKGTADVVVERYGKPIAAIIPYVDYEALLEERGRAFGMRTYADCAEMLERERPDGVSVPTPAHPHRNVAPSAGGQGAHAPAPTPMSPHEPSMRACPFETPTHCLRIAFWSR